MPPEHAAFLRRGTYPVHPAAALDDRERELLSRYGYWLEALSTGTLSPSTPEQIQFVRVARGEAEPRSAFELAWAKQQWAAGPAQPRVGPMELAGRLERLQEARAALVPVQKEYAERRAAIMEQVQPLLEALDAEFADRLRPTREEASRLEAEAREAVLAFGASFRHAGVHAVYTRPRVTWDSRRLARYMETHPEVAEFRHVGKPSVSLRFDPPSEALPDLPLQRTAHAKDGSSNLDVTPA
jgi:uncharacterized protein YifE (UPF0438 family)